ncbi:hypothetical protein EWB00_009877 [Schistosoma japonicum]|uniref:Uncharacterized protein n=1 Tax=Schistosoma japonicum TaxID=6182 RepID=A0A4Z2DQL6_SCHJA|nr:hypothetical protein EWB00_009877 [Schistosoma japonicum]TNN18749.1 hypothetical protein EWB00_009877 [Schistosoma japonicum]TNN18750.1 hypothetical protein EWB00_009877 [Schistosoma japonicum]
MLEEIIHSTPDVRKQRRKSTRKSLICAPCSTGQNSDEQPLTSNFMTNNEICDDESLTNKFAKRYQDEIQRWDQLVNEYEARLTSASNEINIPSEEWIKADRVTRKYQDIIYPQRCFNAYDSLDTVANSLSDTYNDIFFELQRLPKLIERQNLFLKSFQKKLCLKQIVFQDSHFGSVTPISVISDYLKAEI